MNLKIIKIESFKQLKNFTKIFFPPTKHLTFHKNGPRIIKPVLIPIVSWESGDYELLLFSILY